MTQETDTSTLHVQSDGVAALVGWRRLALLAGIFCISFSVLAFEVGLTRVFSVMFRYHYAFLAVSGAVCGLGLGGFAWHLISRGGQRVGLQPGWAGLGFAVLAPGSIVLLFGTPLSAILAANLWAAFIPLLPFAFAGAFLAEVFRRSAAQSGRIYQADLAGAALAAVCIVPLLGVMGGLYLVFLLGMISAAGVFCWALTSRDARLVAAGIAVSVALAILWPASVRADFLRVRPISTQSLTDQRKQDLQAVAKPMLLELGEPSFRARIIDSDWTASARTDLLRFDQAETDPLFKYPAYTDGETPTLLIPFHGDLKSVKPLRNQLPYLAFLMWPNRTLLSIGPGGGMDFLLGAMAGFRTMEGVEINTSLARIMERHRDMTGDIWHRRGVSVTIDDGRSFVRRSPKHYDLIISALTHTATTGNTGVALVESYIHTTEAFADYFDHLSPGGRFALVTQDEKLAWRAALTAVDIMQARGMSVPEAMRHILVLRLSESRAEGTPYRTLLVWKRTPLRPEDLVATRKGLAAGVIEPVYVPGVGGLPEFTQMAAGQVSPEALLANGIYDHGQLLNLQPVTDDKPFFIHLSYELPPALIGLLAVSFAASVLYTGVLLGVRRETGQLWRWAVYFSILGVGFMLVEIPLSQKFILFLGHPTLSLAAILFALLIGASMGSRISQSWPLEALPRRVALAGLLVALITLVYALLLSRVLNLFLPLPLAGRLVISAVFLVPLGMALGVPFPSGLRLLSGVGQGEIPWMWGINGLMSVVGSTLAAAGAEKIGFNGCLVSAAVMYGLLVMCVPRTARLKAEA